MQRKEGQPASQKDTVSHIVVSSGKPEILMQAHLASQPVDEGPMQVYLLQNLQASVSAALLSVANMAQWP